ncbi:MAG: T9SS type A sorting domain-containing protein [Ignavibacteria bacterium]|nr:T9SS type A sorting domain-containing protein [Ignavibacteria bacterium]
MRLYRFLILFSVILTFSNIGNIFSQSGWVQQTSNINKTLYSVKFINSSTGICVGENGIIFRTTNGGVNWIQQSTGFQNNLRSLAVTSPSTFYAVGDSGLILKSTDTGLSWFRLSLAKPFYFFHSVLFVNDTIGYIGGVDINFDTPNKIFKTSDGGNNWDSIETIGSFSVTLFFINSEIGWSIIGYDVLGVYDIIKTSNGGLNWNSQFSSGVTPPAKDIFFIDSSYGWLSYKSSVSFPTILRSTNGGNNWITEFPGTGVSINSLFFTDRIKGWGAGDNSVIQATTNGGINWINQTLNQPGINYRSVYFTDSLIGWVVGDSGRILKTTTGGWGPSNVLNQSSEFPDKYSLSQNYPNPFNPSTSISFQLPDAGNVSLKLFDVLGKEVMTLVDEYRAPGSYEVRLDARNLAGGMYFYKLVSGTFSETKKMILVK